MMIDKCKIKGCELDAIEHPTRICNPFADRPHPFPSVIDPQGDEEEWRALVIEVPLCWEHHRLLQRAKGDEDAAKALWDFVNKEKEK